MTCILTYMSLPQIVVQQVLPGSSAEASAMVQEGDVLKMCSAVFGDDMWVCKDWQVRSDVAFGCCWAGSRAKRPCFGTTTSNRTPRANIGC